VATLVGEGCTWVLGTMVAVFAAAGRLKKVRTKIQTQQRQLQPSHNTQEPLLLKELVLDAGSAAKTWLVHCNMLTLVSGMSVDLQSLGSLLLKAVGLHLLFSLNDKL